MYLIKNQDIRVRGKLSAGSGRVNFGKISKIAAAWYIIVCPDIERTFVRSSSAPVVPYPPHPFFYFFFVLCTSRRDRSLSPPASKQPHAATVREQDSRVCPWQTSGPGQCGRHEGERIHISRSRSRNAERKYRAERTETKRKGCEMKKEKRARKSLRAVKSSEHGDGRADIEESGDREEEEKEEKRANIFPATGKSSPPLSTLARCPTISLDIPVFASPARFVSSLRFVSTLLSRTRPVILSSSRRYRGRLSLSSGPG